MRLWKLGSSMSRVPNNHWLRTRPAAHRGLHDLSNDVVENSQSAFEAAAKAGYAIECDLQLSSDGEAIVFHDHKLERLTSGAGRLADRDASDICRLTLGTSTDRIQRFGEFLEQVNDRVPLLIELKNSQSSAGSLEKRTSELLTDYKGEAAVMSFNPRSMGWFAENHPKLLRGQLSQRFTAREYPKLGGFRRWALSNLLLCTISRPHYIGYDVKSLPALAPRVARSLGLPVLAWTVRSEGDLTRARKAADNIIFETLEPSRFGQHEAAKLDTGVASA